METTMTALLQKTVVGIAAAVGIFLTGCESRSPEQLISETETPIIPPITPIACEVADGAIQPFQDRRQTWAPVWTTGVAPLDGGGFQGQTIRNIVTSHWPGSRVRVRLTNRFGDAALNIDSAWVGRHDNSSAIEAGSNNQLLFGGEESVTIPVGTSIVSDELEFPVAAFEALAISVYSPDNIPVPTGHDYAQATSYISTAGDFAADTDNAAYSTTTERWHFVEGVDALTAQRRNTVVALGDSITEGLNSTTDGNNRYPDYLQRRINNELPNAEQMIVLNKGISGNRVLSDGAIPSQGLNTLARLNWDLLTQMGVTDVIFKEGINDLGLSPNRTAEEIIAGITQVAERAKAAGLNVIGGTLMPATTFAIPSYGATPTQEAKRQQINTYLRTSGVYDHLVDFDQVTEDPNNPGVLNPAFDSGDGLHPNDAGYEAMANAVDLSTLTGRNQSAGDPPSSGPMWTPSWITAMHTVQQTPLTNQTLRMIVNTHWAGTSARIRLSNRDGDTEITLGPFSIGTVASGAELVPSSVTPITFNNGDTTVSLPPGADAVSDDVVFDVSQFEDLAVSIHVTNSGSTITGHTAGLQTSYIGTAGDSSQDAAATQFQQTTSSWIYLQGVDVLSPAPVRSIVALGDSITDGTASSENLNSRWPDIFQRRLAQTPGCEDIVVINAGIAGNQLITDNPTLGESTLARLPGDVLMWPNVTDVIALIGTNDIGIGAATADQVIAGQNILLNRIQAQGIRLSISPQTPAGTSALPHGLPNIVEIRNDINCWTRENVQRYDGYVDFASAIEDSDNADNMGAAYDSGDGLHPNDTGYDQMASSVELAQFCQGL
jgi:lysophospholipase L1-like esterase